MSKNYIFGPAIVELTVAQGMFSAELVDPDPFDSNVDLEGATAQIGTTKFIFFSFDESYEEAMFTPTGELDPDHGVTFSNVYSGPILIGGASEDITESGTYEISVYVGEDDPEPEPTPAPDDKSADNTLSKNYIFVDHPYNDVEAIDDKLGKCKKNDGGSDVTPEPTPTPTPTPAADSTPLMINVVSDGTLFVFDKTWQEVHDAVSYGRVCFTTMHDTYDSLEEYIVNLVVSVNDMGGDPYPYVITTAENVSFRCATTDGYPTLELADSQ